MDLVPGVRGRTGNGHGGQDRQRGSAEDPAGVEVEPLVEVVPGVEVDPATDVGGEADSVGGAVVPGVEVVPVVEVVPKPEPGRGEPDDGDPGGATGPSGSPLTTSPWPATASIIDE